MCALSSSTAATRVLIGVLLIAVLVGVGYIGYVEFRTLVASFRNLVSSISKNPTPITSGTPGTACWTTFTSDGLKVDAFLSKNGYNTTATMIVDTGASISAAPRTLADKLHIDVYSGTPVALGSIFGQSKTGYVHNVNLKLQGLNTVQIPIAIFPDGGDSVPYVLGREGFLDEFDLQVSQASGTFCLTQH